jgi:DNA-binding PadR family transcriptional regulator
MKHHANTRRGRQLEALILALLQHGPQTAVSLRVQGERFHASGTGLYHALCRLQAKGVITRESKPCTTGEKHWPGYQYRRETR